MPFLPPNQQCQSTEGNMGKQAAINRVSCRRTSHPAIQVQKQNRLSCCQISHVAKRVNKQQLTVSCHQISHLSTEAAINRLSCLSSPILFQADTLPTVRQTTGCPPVYHLIRERQISFSGHVARMDHKQDQHWVIGVSLRPPSHWRRPCGWPRTSWLRTIDTGVQSVNIGINK